MSTKRLLSLRDLPAVPPRCCKWCAAPLPPRRQLWCGNEHRDLFALLSQGSHQRAAVFARDRGVCSACGLDTEPLRAGWRAAKQWEQKEWRRGWDAIFEQGRHRREPGARYYPGEVEFRESHKRLEAEMLQRLAHLGFKGAARGNFWEADHIIPVIEGGGVRHGMSREGVLANLRTLCLPCHRRETADLARRRADARRDAALAYLPMLPLEIDRLPRNPLDSDLIGV